MNEPDTRVRPLPQVLDRFRLDGTTAFVTGGAQGLGRSISLALAEAGAAISIVDRVAETTTEVNDLRVELLARGSALRYHQADLANTDAHRAGELVNWALAELTGPSVLVNNAGIISRGPALDTDEEDWRRVVDLDLTVPFLLAQAYARRLSVGGLPGSVINLGSINSFQGGVEVASYAAAKHGLLGLTRALANEWSSIGIRVNALVPGYMSTAFTRAHREDPVRRAAMTARIPADRWGEPDDLAGAAIFLASRASAYVAGACLTVDGGWLAR